MCGIAGLVGSAPGDELRAIAAAMGATLQRRGPDSDGVWADPAAGVALAHRRLAVLDLSAAGHQPMASADARYLISFNGEIYNHLELRAELAAGGQAPAWRGSSDTETLLAAIAAWGLRPTLARLRGMFAFGLWDAPARTLTLVRDPFGEKPVYYAWLGGRFAFASVSQALRVVPGWRGDLDPDAVDFFTRYSYIPAPATVFRQVRKLPAGTLLEVRPGGPADPRPEAWASAANVAPGPATTGDAAAAVVALEALLERSVRERMLADVPLGALFSGGIDSTTIVALMQRAAPRPVQTFTVGFSERGFDEAGHARRLAAFLGTEHHEIYVRPRDALEVVPQLPELWDEPFADPSQLPSYLVARFARRHVTVALAGDGGDELFCGYRHYAVAGAVHARIRGLPQPLRRLLAGLLAGGARLRLRPGPAGARLAEQLARLAQLVGARTPGDFCTALLAVHAGPSLVPGAAAPVAAPVPIDPAALVEGMMELDLHRYLPENIMTKSDRASMGVSLELRAPFLDPVLAGFARRLPLGLKLRDGQSKWVLRQVLHRLVPRELVERPKAGFAVPLAAWLRGELAPWAEDLLAESSLRRSGLYDPVAVRDLWREHRAGRRLRQRVLWNVLMFQAWWLHWEAR
jgi:asparagine synthase (glutamine-hydrolysing)